MKTLGKKIILQPVEEVKKGGLLLTVGVKPTQYKVITVGDEVSAIKAGDIVYLDKHQGKEIEHGAEKFLVIDVSCILAVLD